MEFNVEATLAIIGGCAALYYSGKSLLNEKFAENYVKKSPKAVVLRKILGVEKTIKLIRTIFAPVGILVGILLILFGILRMI